MVGFTADRLSTPEGHAAFLTFARSEEGSPLTPFASVKYGTADGSVTFPFGANLALGPGWVVQAVNDGKTTHLVLSRHRDGRTLSFVLARSRYPGFQLSVGF